MSKKKIDVKMLHYGQYTKWDRDSKDIPEIVKITTKIPACIGIEFGYVLHILKAKNKQIAFKIDHPPFPDSSGEIAPPFTGEVFIRTNDYHFFLGDTVWEPAEDKVGIWHLTCEIEGELVADKSFELVAE